MSRIGLTPQLSPRGGRAGFPLARGLRASGRDSPRPYTKNLPSSVPLLGKGEMVSIESPHILVLVSHPQRLGGSGGDRPLAPWSRQTVGPRAGSRHPPHGRVGRQSLQSHAPHRLPAAAGGGQAEAAGPRHRQVQAAGDPQRDAEAGHALVRGAAPSRRSSRLICKTVPPPGPGLGYRSPLLMKGTQP